MVAGTQHADWRQVLLIGRSGKPEIHTGSQALGVCGQKIGKDCAAAGNLLDNEKVPDSMVDAFESSNGTLAQRLVATMKAALNAGGEAGPVHSMGVQVADKVPWPVIDLRVDWSDQPFDDLEKLWEVYQPQIDAYVTRAVNPDDSPSYGVPGDL